jgi:hypothetical protein
MRSPLLAQSGFEAPVLAGGEPCRYNLRSFINSNPEGQRYSWMNASRFRGEIRFITCNSRSPLDAFAKPVPACHCPDQI